MSCCRIGSRRLGKYIFACVVIVIIVFLGYILSDYTSFNVSFFFLKRQQALPRKIIMLTFINPSEAAVNIVKLLVKV